MRGEQRLFDIICLGGGRLLGKGRLLERGRLFKEERYLRTRQAFPRDP